MHTILISVGSNINRTHYTRAARAELEQHFDNVKCSSVYESESVGFNGKPFYNWVASAQTSLLISDVIALLHDMEARNGRVRGGKKFCSRTLDLDLLLYDNEVTTSPVELPRAEILYNAFVLQPLAELTPKKRHPVCNKSYAKLWQNFDKTRQKIWPISFAWSATT